MTTTWMIVLASVMPALGDAGLRPIFDAIRQVETGGEADPANALGDGGRSLGPYQITWAYWKDSGVEGRYRMVRNKAYAERVMVAYWSRYCPQALARRHWQTLARIHNGGPAGASRRQTLAYWRRVERELTG